MRHSIDVVRFVHGIADYVLAVLIVFSPWLSGFSDHRPAMMITVGFGAVMAIYSALTDYELGVFRVIPFLAHLGLDAVGGGLLIAAPFLFGFADRVWVPHLVLGIVEASFAALTLLLLGIRHLPIVEHLRHGRPAHH